MELSEEVAAIVKEETTLFRFMGDKLVERKSMINSYSSTCTEPIFKFSFLCNFT